MSQATTRDDVTESEAWRTFLTATSEAVTPCTGGEEWTSDDDRLQRRAAELCQGCAVLQGCRTYALATGERNGVLGGLTALDRKRIRRRRSGAA
ncbi:WhiB family transcriptional regulator [Arthrobacter sp. H41]|uniref:WhiB family transcriptional regulator n=1 Tax=Arthrobacter sp. H41 TaxID=1312978 RepID=UPI0009DFBBED